MLLHVTRRPVINYASLEKCSVYIHRSGKRPCDLDRLADYFLSCGRTVLAEMLAKQAQEMREAAQ